MERGKAEHEGKLHRVMQSHDVEAGAAKGGLLGASAGRAFTHGAKPGHQALATVAGGLVGAGVGSLLGRLRGKERTLRDTVQQERAHERAEARMKKAELDGFEARIKQADAFTAIGQGVMGAGVRAARATGHGGQALDLVRRGVKAVGGEPGIAGRMELAKRVGQGTAAVGAGVAGAAAYEAGKSR